jgi:xanthine dehydrogenase large subunit
MKADDSSPLSVVGASLAHESAHLHVAGAASYTDDIVELNGTLHAALGLSPIAHGELLGVDVEALRSQEGVVDVLLAADIVGRNDCGPIIHDDPVLAEGEVRHVGQPVYLVVAIDRLAARRAAGLAGKLIQVRPLPATLSYREAAEQGLRVLPDMRLQRESAPGACAQAIANAPHRLEGRLDIGGQEQFYLEGQISYAVPQEDGGMLVYCSTQHPSEMQHAVAGVLGVPSHCVQVVVRRMGGGFGGKESQSALFACAAAVAAQRLGRPVKLRLDRDDDFMITGRRHCFSHDYSVGFDDQGRLLAAQVRMVSRAGHSADLSGPVMTRALCHFDNAYFIPEVLAHGISARTHTQSNTAFRGFGGPQGALPIELIIDRVARRLRLDPLTVRMRNLYAEGQTTPYGQKVSQNILPRLIDQLSVDCNYLSRRDEISRFNHDSPVLKKGLALTPVKFGIAFNLSHLNQAGALVHAYTDGSILVNHGGTEMGQGLNTKVAQVVAHELGLSLSRVRVTATDTHKVANTSATAASTGSDLNGMAARDAARRIRDRLADHWVRRRGGSPDDLVFAGDQVSANGEVMSFEALVREAYTARVQLWSEGFYATPGLSWDAPSMQGSPFQYFAYGAAASEVLIDTLTGEYRLLRADILHDAGRSLNPALDIGQVEGGFIQGMGWLTMEELVWHPQTGKLLTHAPSTYKIPTANDCPPVFNVRLYDEANAADTIHRSKAVGEPPLLLSFSVFLAIRDAIAAVGGPEADPPLNAPATPEAVLMAVDAVRAARCSAAA